MELSNEIIEMLDVIKAEETGITRNGTYKIFYSPNIPEKNLQRFIKSFDNHIATTAIVAFIDVTVLGSAKSGIIFTNDGVYYKEFSSKAFYFNYKDVDYVSVEKNSIIYVNFKDISTERMTIYSGSNALKTVIEELISIDCEYGQSSQKTSGKVKKLDLPEDIQKKCHGIIHGAATTCGGVGTGLAQIPLSDNAVIVPIQVGMIVALGKVFDLNITESTAKSIIASAGASIAGRAVSQVLWGWIPGVGNAINTATAAGLTEAIGWLAVANFYNRWIEDRNKGRYEGMKDGYAEASGEYERKLRKQADEFINQMRDVQKERNEYEKLLSEYETYIKELEAKSAAVELISEMRDIYGNLKNLRTA